LPQLLSAKIGPQFIIKCISKEREGGSEEKGDRREKKGYESREEE
jgi:hypothetical protein